MKNKYRYSCKYVDNEGCMFSKTGHGETVREIIELFDDYWITEIEIKYRK